MSVPSPNYIFEVIPSAVADEKFERLQGGRELLYAYHGSRLDNSFSILNNGLAFHMNKVSARITRKNMFIGLSYTSVYLVFLVLFDLQGLTAMYIISSAIFVCHFQVLF